MPAVLVDVGHHFVEPNLSGQTVLLSVDSTSAQDPGVAGFELRAQIVTAKQGPFFQGVRFAGDLWNSFPHIESGSPLPTDPTLASGYVSFTQGFEAQADGTLVKLMIDTTGIPAGSYEFRLVGTKLGSSSFRRADGSSVAEVITNGTLQVRSIWQNPDNPSDINGDGRISPVDVLLLLNELSKKGSHELPMPSSADEPTPRFDVNGDGYLSPLDPLEAINCLNGLGCSTTPKPIFAKVTPNSTPVPPNSTGVDQPQTNDPKSEESPVEDTDGETFPICGYYELENELPVAVECNHSEVVDSVPLPVGPTLWNATTVDASDVVRTSSTVSEESTAASPVLSPPLVDAVITDLANKLFDTETNEELVHLGLSGALV